MDFTEASFGELLERFELQAQAFAAEFQRALCELVRADFAYAQALGRKQREIEEAIERNRSAREQQERLKREQLAAGGDFRALRQQLEHEVAALRAENSRLGEQVAQLGRLIRQGKEQQDAAQTPRALLQRQQMYKRMLRMGLRADGRALRVEFYDIGGCTRSVELALAPEGARIAQISHPIQNARELIEEFGVTGNLALLVRKLRRGFVQAYSQ